ncbi:MAG: SusD/RagB family nutrient-binding outer membrane lipoprotein [Bacteroidetes bacterium]|nr:MAG: SusD/RagB family nutrient-binding outer membrane lipoprotein [Bacteroidota bacterium]
MKRNYKKYFLILVVVISASFSSCEKGFEGINTSVDFVSTPTLEYVLPFVELTMVDRNYYTQTYYAAAYAGQINTNVSFPSITAYKETEMSEHWVWIYRNPLKNIVDFIERCQDDPDKINYLSIGRILRVYLLHSVTDSYGDIPYFEAIKGYSAGITTPKYDPQQAIYGDMFKELTEAAAALTASKTTPGTADIVYNGDIVKWKKFANSLMLRLALRIVKADPVNSKKYIEQAIAGGLMTSTADNFVVNYTTQVAGTGTTSNGTAHTWISSSYITTYRLAQPFVDSLKLKNDPRTPIYCMREKLPLTSYQEGSHDPAVQRGRDQFVQSVQRDSASVANIRTFGRYAAPFIHLSYPQVQFQLAEAVVRNIIPGDAKTYYENGVKAAMSELSILGTDGWNPGAITVAQQNAYLTANPYDPANALRQINTQYWIETFPNYYEAWANMRRTGFPDTYSQLNLSLSGNLGAQLPRRLFYPRAEYAANANINEAVSRQGPDLTSTRVWWDKP